MRLFSKKKNESKGAPNLPPPIIIGNGEQFHPISSDNNLDDTKLIKLYNTLPEVQIPINYIMDNMTDIPYKHVKVLRDGSYVAYDNSSLIATLNKPNQWDNTASQFKKHYFLNRLVLGKGYINRIGENGVYSQLYVLPSEKTYPVVSTLSNEDIRLDEITGYVTDFGRGKIKINPELVVSDIEASFKPQGINSLDTNGVSRLYSAYLLSESLRYNYEAKVKTYKDRGAMGLIYPKDSNAILTPDASKKLKAQFYDNIGITGNKSPFVVGSVPLDYTAVTLNITELQLIENRISDFNMICGLYGVDPVIFGLTPGTYQNKLWATVNAYEDTIIPTFNSYLELLGRVFNLPNDEKFVADYSGIAVLQAENDKRVNTLSTMFKDGIIDRDEYRKLMGIV